jgi:hypothetical protein
MSHTNNHRARREVCGTHRKQRYATEEIAREAAILLKIQHPSESLQYPFYNERCKSWHLSHFTDKGFDEYKRNIRQREREAACQHT